MAQAPLNVLFLCTGNSARSIMAEAIMNRIGARQVPRLFGRLHAQGRSPSRHALKLLKRNGLHDRRTSAPSAGRSSPGPDAPQLDFVFTVCDNAAGEVCPIWPGQPMTAHWGIPDPAAATGNPAEIALAFADAYRMLNNRISLFTSLPLASLDRLSLQRRLDEIGQTGRSPHAGALTCGTRSLATPAWSRRCSLLTAPQRLAAEALGTALLLAIVIGSGIMGERLAGGNVAIALLGNTLATGAGLVVLITIFGPLSGAHFNPGGHAGLRPAPARSAGGLAAAYVVAQLVGGVLGVWAAHAMFAEADPLQVSTKLRDGPAQAFAEFVATFGLIAAILGSIRFRPDATPMIVGLYITSAYWFTASTSFANPAVTIARSLSNTFAGIAPSPRRQRSSPRSSPARWPRAFCSAGSCRSATSR